MTYLDYALQDNYISIYEKGICFTPEHSSAVTSSYLLIRHTVGQKPQITDECLGPGTSYLVYMMGMTSG